MILSINDNKFIIDLQEKFNECFPFLKIEFYDKPCTSARMPAVQHLLPANLRLGDIRKTHDPGLLDIKSYYKTERLELDFKELFGLNVQVFRRENNRWIRTHNTKSLTLQQQSQIAELVTHTVRNKKELAEEGNYGYQ